MDVSLETVPCIGCAVTDMIATASQVPGCLEQLMQYWRKEKAVCLDLLFEAFEAEVVDPAAELFR